MTESAERNSNSRKSNEERQIIELAQSGDLDALGILYDLNVNRVFRYSLLRLGNHQDAEDVTQVVFIRTIEGLSGYKYTNIPFGAWLMRITRNEVITFVRKNRKRKNEIEIPQALSDDRSSLDPQISLERLQQLTDLRLSIQKLSEFQREVIILRYAAGLTVEETARTLGKKPNNVKKTTSIAIDHLRVSMGSKYPELLK